MKRNTRDNYSNEAYKERVKAKKARMDLAMEELRLSAEKKAKTYRFKPDEKERQRIKELVAVANHVASTPKNYYANTSVYGRQRMF
jgi:hypothetical protein